MIYVGNLTIGIFQTERLRTIRDELNTQISKAEKRLSPYVDTDNA